MIFIKCPLNYKKKLVILNYEKKKDNIEKNLKILIFKIYITIK